jgi:hypothetical protein
MLDDWHSEKLAIRSSSQITNNTSSCFKGDDEDHLQQN